METAPGMAPLTVATLSCFPHMVHRNAGNGTRDGAVYTSWSPVEFIQWVFPVCPPGLQTVVRRAQKAEILRRIAAPLRSTLDLFGARLTAGRIYLRSGTKYGWPSRRGGGVRFGFDGAPSHIWIFI